MRKKSNLRLMVVAVMVVLIVAGSAWADELHVPIPYGTIQEAIDNAVGGDVVIVADGIYTGAGNKNLDFGGRAITVRSENGPESTIIDCENNGRGFYFHSGEDSNSTLRGLTVTNGRITNSSHGSYDGGAILCEDNSNPTIANCYFTSNSAERNGGAIGVSLSSPTIKSCAFTQNKAGHHAGAVSLSNSNAMVDSCVFIENHCDNYSADGGAMYIAGVSSPVLFNCIFIANKCDWPNGAGGAIRTYTDASPTITHCTFVGNKGSSGGAIANVRRCNPIINNCVFWNNDARAYGDEILNDDNSHPVISFCDIQGGWNGSKVNNRRSSSVINGGGNINADPGFISGPFGEYYLSQIAAGQTNDSPCVDAGSDMASSLGMDLYSTRTDEIADEDIVDIGYHYPAISRILVSLEIDGSDECAENSQVQYRAIAVYDDDSTRDVTGTAIWSVDPNINCEIEEGLLTTQRIDLPEDVVITVEYGEGENAKIAEKDVSIFAVCPSEGALEFDGDDDYVDLGSTVGDNLAQGSFTVWVYPADLSDYCGRWNFAYIIAADEYIGGELGIRVYGDGRAWTAVNNLTGGSQPDPHIYTPEGTFTVGSWHHVALTWDGSYWKIYVNGLLKGQAENSAGTTSSTNTTMLGKGWDGCTWDGAIDEACFFDRALSAEEIGFLMQSRPDVDDPSLVGYWDLDEGSGQYAYDTSGEGNNGRLGFGAETDDGDPKWVESGAPIYRCSLEELVERNMNEVLEIKLGILDELRKALDKEDAVLEMLNEHFTNRDFGTAEKSDVVKAKQRIHIAIQHEEQAEDALEKSIVNIDNTLDDLDVEDETESLTSVEFWPKVINLKSQRKWLGCVIGLDEGCDVGDVDTESIVINGQIEPLIVRQNGQMQSLIAIFDISELWGGLEPYSEEFVVSGEFLDGSVFECSDMVKVMR